MAIKWLAGHETYKTYPNGYANEGVVLPTPTYDGAVLGTTGRTERVMSDVWEWVSYAVVWDGEKVKEVAISTDGWKPYGEVVVDATPETLVAVAVWKAAEAVKAEAEAVARAKARAEAEAMRVAKGKTITVVKGRKVAKGTTGTCIWMGEGHWGWRVGLKDAAGEVYWTAASNVEVVLPVAA